MSLCNYLCNFFVLRAFCVRSHPLDLLGGGQTKKLRLCFAHVPLSHFDLVAFIFYSRSIFFFISSFSHHSSSSTTSTCGESADTPRPETNERKCPAAAAAAAAAEAGAGAIPHSPGWAC
jgi:hypothetical protein